MPSFANGASGSAVRALLNDTGLRKNNYTATTNPTVNADVSNGYEIGSEWVNTAAGTKWLALSVAVGAAVWQRVLTTDTPADITQATTISDTDRVLTVDSSVNPQSVPASVVIRGDASAQRMVVLTAAAYAALGTKVSTTLYVIVG